MLIAFRPGLGAAGDPTQHRTLFGEDSTANARPRIVLESVERRRRGSPLGGPPGGLEMDRKRPASLDRVTLWADDNVYTAAS